MGGWVVLMEVLRPPSSSTNNSRPRAASLSALSGTPPTPAFYDYMENTLIPLKRVPSFGRGQFGGRMYGWSIAVHL